MRLTIAYCLALLILVAATTNIVAQATLPVAPPGVEPIVTQERLFSIPFYLNPRQPLPNELLLYVSGNQGRQWTLYQKRAPDQRRFDFQAGDEGEYWFLVRTPFSTTNPSVQSSPEKIVVVDETVPQLEVQIEQTATGQIKARWKAQDAYLDTSTFRITYQNPGDDSWYPITVRLPVTTGDSTFEGDVAWKPEAQEGAVLVRIEVYDRAGNDAIFQEAITLHSVAQQNVPANRQRVDIPPSPLGPDATVVDRSDDGRGPLPALPRLPSSPSMPSSDMVFKSKPIDNSRPDRLPGVASPQELDSKWRGSPEIPKKPSGNWFDEKQFPFDWPSESVTQNRGPVPAPLDEPVAEQFDPNRPASPPQQLTPRDAGTPPASPVEVSTQVTRSRRFNLDYEITDAGDSGVARVELWITSDGGRSWSAYMTDEDRQSPLLVELDSEGTFGFRLLIHNGMGTSSRPPQPGDSPDLTVTVDATPPQGTLTQASFGKGINRHRLNVAWQISDPNLDESSLRLSYADRPIGPWLPLGAPVSGGHSQGQWQIDFRLPPEIYLKLEMRDRAGNIGEIIHSHPVRTVPAPPAGRIRAVRPIQGL